MEWRDIGIILSQRSFGEKGALVSTLTAEHGRHSGFVWGAKGKGLRGVFQPGNIVLLTWKARLNEQLGQWTGELIESRVADILEDGGRLSALTSFCAILEKALPERLPYPQLYRSAITLLSALDKGEWPAAYVRWELSVLSELGYGLDLTSCAATGVTEGLCFVSPRSGRAVCRHAGEPYQRQLLPLPAFLLGEEGTVTPQAVCAGLSLTGFFLERHVFDPQGRTIPSARKRLVDRLGGRGPIVGP